MTKRAQLHDGTILEFPADTPDEVIDRTVMARTNAPANDSAVEGFLVGAVKPLDKAAEWLTSTAPGKAIDNFGASLGLPTTPDAVAGNQARRDANTRSGWQTVGNVAGTLPLAAMPGGLATQGGAAGALLSDADTPGELVRDAGIGAIGNVVGGKLISGAGAAISPHIGNSIRRLSEAGIKLTPGQIMKDSKSFLGRAVSQGEEALSSTPFIGDAINMARSMGTEDFNKALGSRVLENIGLSLPKSLTPGPDFVTGIRNLVSRKYDNLVPKLSATFDQQFMDDLGKAKDLMATVPDEVQSQFEKIMRNVFTNRANGSGISGQALKDAESRLTALKGTYAKSANGDHHILADAIGASRQALRDIVSRGNPAHAPQLQALNTAWAQLKPMKAVSDIAADGVITAGRMYQAVRKTGFPDKLTRTAAARLPNATPDSGTARRGMMGLLGTAIASGTAGSLLSPALAVPAIASSLYTKRGMTALNKMLFAQRGPATKAVGEGLRVAGNSIPGIGPAFYSLLAGGK